MKPLTTLISTLIFAATMVGSGAAAGPVSAANPSSVVGFFFNQNIPTKLSADNYGDPLIEVRDVDGHGYIVVFFGCTENTDCTNMQLYRGYETDGKVTLDVVNKLNTDNRFAKFSIDDEDDVTITADIWTGKGGIDPEDFGQLFAALQSAAMTFEKEVKWVSD